MNLVKQSLYLCIGVLLALIGLQGAQSLWQVNRLAQDTTHIIAGNRVSGAAQELWTRFVEAESALAQATAFVDATSAGTLRTAYNDKVARLRASVQTLQGAATGDLAEAAKGVAGQIEAWLRLAAPHVGAEGVTELPSYHRLEASKEALQEEVRALLTVSAEAAAGAVANAQGTVRTITAWTVANMVLAVAVGLLLGWHALRSLHRQLGADASEVARAANTVADGDLSAEIRADGVPEGSVMAAIARMQSSLRQTVVRVRAISDGLADGAKEIASGNQDLSQRTERQAAALERTSSTMEQVGATVRHNLDHAQQASVLADEASAVAREGGDIVGRTVETMRGINESSKRIAEIIGVIDGIAFQTNILALNAAVEAARAGEDGRGFAVVAGEVRSLAHRSADAAHQIKDLITASVTRVEHGSALVEQAGRTMTEVVDAIGRVTVVMSEIRASSAEQSSGIDQVGQAVREIDQSTQQNAALAEQTSAAAEHLKGQGQALVDAVAFFRT